MIWKALMQNKEEIYEYSNGEETLFNDLDQSKVCKFTLLDGGSNIFFNFSSDSGIVNFNNFDIGELKKLNGSEQLKLQWDSRIKKFKFTKHSLALFKQLYTTDKTIMNYMEVNDQGLFNINGDEFKVFFKTRTENTPFFMRKIQRLIHYKNAHSEAIFDRKHVLKRQNDYTTEYALGYTTKIKYISAEFKLIYNKVNKQVTFSGSLNSTDKSATGDLVIFFLGKEYKLSMTLMKNQSPTSFSRLITIM